MPEIRLAPLRIGFAYSAQVNFPAGFLGDNESCRGKLRKFVGQSPAPAVFTDERLPGTQSILLSLTEEQTADLEPGTYKTELIAYDTTNPAAPETPLTTNVYTIEADFSPSE